jgi:NAD(P)-dependent dehydrogenase (short-subunit alcohol dehydrogenase family)/acyl carrier protein
VLEQAPPRPDRPHRPGPHLLVFSAVDGTALSDLTGRLREHLAEHRDEDIADVAFTLQVSRGGFALRRAVVCHDYDDAVAALSDPARWIDGKTQRRNPRVRLVTPDTVPDTWWAELGTAVAALLGADATTVGTADSVVSALADGLTRLGVRILREEPAQSSEVEEVVVAPGKSGTAAEWLLGTLAGLWQAGSGIDWPAVHRGAGRRVELPTYPFQRRRYWVDAKPSAFNVPDVWWSVAPSTTGKNYDRSQWTYLPTWQLRPRPVADLDEQLRLAGPWLVLTADERGEALVSQLIESGVEVTAVRPGDCFDQDEAGDFTVRVDDPDDLAELLGSLVVSPRSIVHGFSLASPDCAAGQDLATHFDAEQQRGFYSALALARAMVDDTGSAPRAELILLTSGAVGVVGSDLRHPEHSTLAALGPSLAQENPRLRCRHIDADVLPAGNPGAATLLINQVLAAAVSPHEGPVAVRANEVWLRRYEPFPIDELAQDDRPIRTGDTVLITGGLGDVGLVLSRHLAGKYGCQLVLTARSELPPREQWAAYLAAVPAGGERTARHIRNILDLEERGASVLALSADVADLDQMRAVVDAAVDRFGGIDVVVHGAGVQDGRFFNFAHLMDRTQCDAHLATKVKGFLVLQEVLAEHNPTRRITLSSIAGVLGGMTLAPYAAANAALDAYTRVARMSDAGQWITVDWDTWNINPERVEGHSSAVTDFTMAPAEGVDVWERALSVADRTGHLVISTGSLDARIAQWVTGDIHATDDDEVDDRERHPRPELSTPFVAPREGTEATLAEVWSRVLGIEPIGAVDNFFELGGHSLIAIELTARIRKALGAVIPVTGLLEYPTVRQLAELIDSAGSDEERTADHASA